MMLAIFAYFSPEASLPVASAAAAALGFVLTMGRLSIAALTRWFRVSDRRPR